MTNKTISLLKTAIAELRKENKKLTDKDAIASNKSVIVKLSLILIDDEQSKKQTNEK